MFGTVCRLLGTAASGLSKRPRWEFLGRPAWVPSGLRESAKLAKTVDCHQPEGSHADAEREGREVRFRAAHRPHPSRARHGCEVRPAGVVVLSVEEYERLKALDAHGMRPETEFITPALHGAGWDEMSQLREEVSFTKGRIIARGKLVARGKRKRADYILDFKPNIPKRGAASRLRSARANR